MNVLIVHVYLLIILFIVYLFISLLYLRIGSWSWNRKCTDIRERYI